MTSASTAPAIDPAVLARLDQVPALAGPDRTIEPLPGGLTNLNVKVTVPSGRYVARLSTSSTGWLGIDRDNEHANAVAAHCAGVAPEVVDFRPDLGVLVVRWIDGHTLGPADVAAPSMIDRIAAACRRLHSAAPFARRFDMFEVQQRYLDTALQNGFRLPDRYIEFMPRVADIRTVLAMQPPALRSCHNDLLAENFIDGPDQLWIIDFEYSGTNDPCFELGNIASESHLDRDQTAALVHAYFGAELPRMLARCELQAVMSQYGWTLWGVIQHATSDVEFDFWEWAMDKFDRAAGTFTGGRLGALLDSAADDP